MLIFVFFSVLFTACTAQTNEETFRVIVPYEPERGPGDPLPESYYEKEFSLQDVLDDSQGELRKDDVINACQKYIMGSLYEVIVPYELPFCFDTGINTLPYYCGTDECMFFVNNVSIAGYGELTGYYMTYTGTSGWDESKKLTCEGITITSGNERILMYYKNLHDNGKLFSQQDIHRETSIFLDLEKTDKSLAQKIKSSTRENPVTVGVIFHPQGGMGVDICYSPLSVVGVR